MNLPENIKIILNKLNEAGCDAYVVGGSLRDALLHREANDWDIASSATPERVMEIFSDHTVIPTGLKHGTVTLVDNGEPIEITTFRTDGEYTDSRHPESVTFALCVEDDLSRRDFTVNAMAYNETRGLVDLFGGRDDLENKLIRCVGEAEKRFAEDALRIMRAFRFSSQLGFEIEDETLAAAHRMKAGLKNIARERIGHEFLRLLEGDGAVSALKKMGDIIEYVIPTPFDRSRYELLNGLESDAVARLALLLCGENTADAAHALRLSSKESSRLKRIATPPSKERLDRADEAEMRRILFEYGDDAVIASRAACLTLGADAASVEILRRVKAKNYPLTLADLAVNGSDLIKCGVASGRNIGTVLDFLHKSVLDDPSLNTREKLLRIAENEAYHE